MKKFLKILLITLLIIISILFVGFFTFKGKISLFLNIAKKYSTIKNDPSSLYNSSTLEPMESMDYKDVIYKNTNGTTQTLDIYSAKKKLTNGSPVILYVHGGSWAYGDKTIPKAITPLLDSFREEGITVISTSYELMREKQNFKKQISDVKDTIRWIHKNKDVYGFNPNEIGIIGTSSGAQLSLIAAYSEDSEFKDDEKLSNYPSSVKYVIDFFGPTDLKTLDLSLASWDLKKVLNSTKSKEDILEKYSPINYVKESIPKTLIVHSKLDKIVPYENSIKLYEKSKSLGNNVKLLTLKKSGHDLSNINKQDIASLSIEILKFIILNSPL